MPDFQPLTGLVGRLPTDFEQPSNPGEIDKNGFLRLMIEQLKYQDPLNPMDSQQYASQLAEFTALEEQQNGNALLEQGLNADILLAQSINNTLAATLVGQDVKAVGNTVAIDEGVVGDLSFEMGAAGGNVEVQVYDATGALVRTITERVPGGGEHSISWDGLDDLGQPLADGLYTYEPSLVSSDGTRTPLTPILIGRVEAVRYEDSGAVLVVDGQTIAFGDVLELRSGSSGGDDGGTQQEDPSTNPLSGLLGLLGLRGPSGAVR